MSVAVIHVSEFDALGTEELLKPMSWRTGDTPVMSIGRVQDIELTSNIGEETFSKLLAKSQKSNVGIGVNTVLNERFRKSK